MFSFFYLYNKTQSDVLASLKDDLQYISILQNFGHATSASHTFAMNGLQLSQILVPPLKFALETFFNNQELKVHKQDIREKAISDHRVGQIRCQAVSFIQICGKLFKRLMIHTHMHIMYVFMYVLCMYFDSNTAHPALRVLGMQDAFVQRWVRCKLLGSYDNNKL